MIWVFVVIGAVVVVAIAVVAIGVAVGRLEHETAPAIYELEDAVEFIAEELPEEVTARVSFDDVRTVLRWHLDWFTTVGLATRYGQDLGDEAVAVGDWAVAADQAAVDAVVARSLRDGGPEAIDVVCILDLQMRYLAEIGAVGPRADDGPDPAR
jgi:hypothetical protein